MVDDRIYPNSLPQDTELPAIAYQGFARRRHKSHSGPSHLGERYFDVRCWGANYTAASALAKAAGDALDCYEGTIAGEEVQVALVTGGFDLDHEDPDNPDSREACVVVTVKFWHTE
jgi:hypothetical protein